jgi:hypothetical protein
MFLVAAYFTHRECFRMIIKSLSPISNDPNEVNQPNVEDFFESFLVKPFKLKVNYHPIGVDLAALHYKKDQNPSRGICKVTTHFASTSRRRSSNYWRDILRFIHKK